MNRAGQVLFIAGIFIALFAGFLVFVLLTLARPKPADISTTSLVVAYQNILPRTEITADQVGMEKWPVALPTPIGAFSEVDSVAGKLSVGPVSPGQVLTDKMLIDKGDAKETHSSASLVLEKGTVAVALPVTVKSNVAEAIQAGDHVDVIATFKSTNASAAITTHRLLADVLVLQVGTWPNPTTKSQSNSGATVVTLELKEQDSMVIVYAREFADDVTLVLRAADDHSLPTLDPVTFDYINQRFGYKMLK